METKDFQLRLKALEETGAFTGLAAVYGDLDLAGDIILPGAFAKSIGDQGRGFPLLWSHRSDEPIGIGQVEDSKAGLVIHGQLLMADPAAVRAHAHMKAGTVRGLSIGFTIPRTEGAVEWKDDVRYLKAIKLHEVSVVAIPAAPRAQITTVKSLGDVEHLFHQIQAGDELADGALEQLEAIDRELKALLKRYSPQEQANAELLSALRGLNSELLGGSAH